MLSYSAEYRNMKLEVYQRIIFEVWILTYLLNFINRGFEDIEGMEAVR